MKKKISKILGVVLSLALLSSLAIVSVPVAAQPGENEFEAIDGPPIATNTGVGVMGIAPDGTIYAAVLNAADLGRWSVWKSVDEGTNWDPTEFTGYASSGGEITDIAISPNYEADGTFYVSLLDARIFRIGDEGDATPVLLKSCVDSYGTTAGSVYDLDLWYDGDVNWILAGTDLDVMVLRDALFEDWRDQELASYGDERPAYEVAYAPDFNSSELIWAVVDTALYGGGWFMVTSTVSPGQWGNTIEDALLINHAPPTIDRVRASRYVDLEFSDYYTTADPILYIGCTDTTSASARGNIFLVQGAYVGEGMTEVTPLLPTEDDILSVEVSGNVILAGTYNASVGPQVRLYRSDNLGDTFSEVVKSPTGWANFYVYMAPGDFDPDEGHAYCSSQSYSYDESAFSITEDGALTWNQNSWVDTYVYSLWDMAFAPEAASQPAFQISYGAAYDSLWRSDDVTADDPEWVRVLCTQIGGPSYYFERVEYSMDGTTVMLYGLDLVGPAAYEIWKSTDNGQTFNHWRTTPSDIGYMEDLKVYDGSTIYAACGGGAYGFYGTSRFGPATKELAGVQGVSLALQPGFDPDDPDNSTIILGTYSRVDTVPDPDVYYGEIFVSTDAGENWGDANVVRTDTTTDFSVYVAFDAEYADNGLIYFATSNSIVGQATVDGDELDDIEPLTDDTNGGVAEADSGFTGIGVSNDNTLYAIGYTGYEAPSTEYGPPIAWGSIEMDPSGASAVVVDGSVDLAGSGATAVDLDINPIALIVTAGTFGSEALDISGSNLWAVSETVVAGTIFFAGGTGDTAYSTVVFTGLTGFTPDEVVSVTEDTSDPLACDPAGDTVAVAIMGEPIVDTTGDWDNNDEDVLSVVGTTLTAVSPSFISGQIALTNVAAETGDLMGLTFVGDFGATTDEDIDSLVAWDLVCIVDEYPDPGASSEASMWRLLLHDDLNIWETADVDGASRVWVTEGSNYVWTVVYGWDLYGLEDTLSGPVEDVAVSGITETGATISWYAMTGADVYEGQVIDDVDWAFLTDETSFTFTDELINNTDYDVRVRVAPQPLSSFSSRWSSWEEFATAEAVAKPKNLVPENGMQSAPLLPSFVWEEVSNAEKYEFELSADTAFGSLMEEATITAPTTAYTCTTELNYDQDYYWRVRAVSTDSLYAPPTYSAWCMSNFHTRMEVVEPPDVDITLEPPDVNVTLPPPEVNVTVVPPDVNVTVIPQDITVVPPEVIVNIPPASPPITITQIEPNIVMPDEVTPVYIWIIVAIGALLTVAVIVLIIRTRRVV